jgi:hypothetical protein
MTNILSQSNTSVNRRTEHSPCCGLTLPENSLASRKAMQVNAGKALKHIIDVMLSNTDTSMDTSFECSLENAVDGLIKATRDLRLLQHGERPASLVIVSPVLGSEINHAHDPAFWKTQARIVHDMIPLADGESIESAEVALAVDEPDYVDIGVDGEPRGLRLLSDVPRGDFLREVHHHA